MKYLLDSNVIIHLANRATGVDEIERRIIAAGMMRAEMHRNGTPISLPDALIAGHA